MTRLHRTALFLLLGLAVVSGCDSYTTLKDVALDCSLEDGYEFLPMSTLDKVGDKVFWGSGDNTPGKSVGSDADGNVLVESMPDGPRCGSGAAAVVRASGNNDWGCLFGFNLFGAPRDASAYEGLSFWARSPGPTTKGFLLLLNDPNTAIMSGVTSHCIDLGAETAGSQAIQVYVDGQAVSTSGAVTRPTLANECGNGYGLAMSVTSDWRLYTIPFGAFQQDPKPNRVPNALLTNVGNVPENGLLTDQLLSLILRMPKAAKAELWLDNLAFYRKKAM